MYPFTGAVPRCRGQPCDIGHRIRTSATGLQLPDSFCACCRLEADWMLFPLQQGKKKKMETSISSSWPDAFSSFLSNALFHVSLFPLPLPSPMVKPVSKTLKFILLDLNNRVDEPWVYYILHGGKKDELVFVGEAGLYYYSIFRLLSSNPAIKFVVVHLAICWFKCSFPRPSPPPPKNLCLFVWSVPLKIWFLCCEWDDVVSHFFSLSFQSYSG